MQSRGGYKPMGQVAGFWESIADGASQNQFAGGLEIDEMAHTHIQRADQGPGAEHHAEAFIFVTERDPGTSFETGFGMGAEEAALGAADGRQVAEDADVAGDAETAWVGEALSIAEQHVGLLAELAEGCEQGGSFTKGKKTGDVGEGQPALGELMFDQFMGLSVPENGGSKTALAIQRKCGVETCDEAEWSFGCLDTYSSGKLRLERAGAARRNTPGMQACGRWAIWHGARIRN